MKRSFRSILTGLLAIVFIGSSALVVRQLYHYHLAEQSYSAASSIATPSAPTPPDFSWVPELPPLAEAPSEDIEDVPLPPDEATQTLMTLNLSALREVNSVVLGWIHIPDSSIDYPLLQVKDNQEYLRRAWDGSANNAGCIFLECANATDFSDPNTLVYGHHMNNGTMFGSLLNYKNQEYWDSHPYVYITTDEGVRRYRVFSTYEAGLVSDTYGLFPEHNERWLTALNYYKDSSVMESDFIPSMEDQVLTLSTCTGTGTYHTRWVVHAVLDQFWSRQT